MKVSSSKNNYQFSDNEYAYIGLSADQTTNLANTNPIKFNTMIAGNITFDPATYRVTLKKNRTYTLKASGFTDYSGATGITEFAFYNVTAAAEIGKRCLVLPVNYSGSYSFQPTITSVITPTVDTVIEVRIINPTNLSKIRALYTYWEIQQINIVSPVIQDISTTLQAGIVMAYTGTVIPVGWLNCDGSAVSRTVYNKLFASISTTWGAGDGSTTFNIPDLRSATLRGVGTPTLYTSNTVIALAQTIDDSAQGHKHSDPTRGYITASAQISNTGTDPVEVNASTYTAKSYYATTMGNDGTNGTPRTGLETTGKARGVFYIIKY